MSSRFFRVDERLIHGQIVVAWGRRFGLEHLIVVSDEIASDRVQQDLYRSGLAASMSADFFTLEEAAKRLSSAQDADRPTMVLTPDLGTMRALIEAGVPAREVVVGGLHAAPGRRRLLPYLWIDDHDAARVAALERLGVAVVGQDVPTGAPVRLIDRLE